MLKSSTIIGGKGSNKRRELDYYPTPKECTIALMDFLQLPKLIIWEPACGTGEMSKVIASYGHTVISSDIRDTGYGEGGIDYLTATKIDHNAVITNPPFNLSEEFIKKATGSIEIVAMLLKSQYWHAKKRNKIFTYKTPSYVLPLTWRPDFTMNGKGSPTMDMIWTVWLPMSGPCEYKPLLKPKTN